MDKDRNEEIDVDFTSIEYTKAKGRRELVYTTPTKSELKAGSPYNFFMPTVDDSTVVIPETIEMEFLKVTTRRVGSKIIWLNF